MSEIDVSKCEHYDDGNCDKYYDIACIDHPECMYKQLQQLKAENEGLKSLNDFNMQKVETAFMILDEIFENIEYIEATAKRIDDDNYIALAYRIAKTSRNILQLIKQAKEGRENDN